MARMTPLSRRPEFAVGGRAALALAALVAAPAFAGPKPPAHEFEGIARLSADADIVWLGGTHALTLAGTPATLDLRQDPDGVLTGTLEVDGVLVPVDGTAKRGAGGTSVRLTGERTLDGEPYASIDLTATVGTKGWKGKAKFRRPSTAVLNSRAAVAGRLRRSAKSAFYVNLLASQTGDGAITGSARLFLPEGTFDVPLTGTARGARGGDTVALTAGSGADLLRIAGKFDGTRLKGSVSGRHRGRRLKRTRVDASVGAETPVLDLGTVTSGVTLDREGRLAAGATLTTDAGAVVTVEPGTGFRTFRGEVIQGDVRIGLDDGDGAAAFAGLAAPSATFRFFVRDADGAAFASPVRFDRPVRVTHQMGDVRGQIGFVAAQTVPGAVAQVSKRAKPPLPDPGASLPAGEVEPDFDFDLAGGTEKIEMTDDLRRRIDFEQRNSTGDVQGEVVHEFEIPGNDTDEWPRVYYVRIETVPVGGIAEIVAIVEGYPGLTLGEGAADHHRGYAVTVSGRGGKRYVTVRTRFRNRLRFRVAYCEEGNIPGVLDTAAPVDPVPPESDPGATEGPYDGALRLFIDGWGEFPDHEKYLRKLEEVLPLDAAVDDDGFDTEAGGRYSAAYRVIGWDGSARQLLALMGLDPSKADIEDRTILYHEDCPPPVAVVSGFDVTKFFVYSLEPFAPLHEIEVGGAARQVVVSPGGTRAWGTTADDRIVLMDLVRGGVLAEVAVPGMGPAIARTPFGGVAVTTDAGAVRTHDGTRLDSFFDVFSGLPTGFHQSVSVSTDGGRAAVAVPGNATVYDIDLLRRRGAAGPVIAGLQMAEFAHDGVLLGATRLPSDRLDLYSFLTSTTLVSATTGDTPVFCRFSEDDRYLVSGNQLGDSVTIYDRQLAQTSTVAAADGSEGLDVFRGTDGNDRVLVGGFDGKELRLLRLDGTPGTSVLAVTYKPGWIDVSGR